MLCGYPAFDVTCTSKDVRNGKGKSLVARLAPRMGRLSLPPPSPVPPPHSVSLSLGLSLRLSPSLGLFLGPSLSPPPSPCPLDSPPSPSPSLTRPPHPPSPHRRVRIDSPPSASPSSPSPPTPSPLCRSRSVGLIPPVCQSGVLGPAAPSGLGRTVQLCMWQVSLSFLCATLPCLPVHVLCCLSFRLLYNILFVFCAASTSFHLHTGCTYRWYRWT